MVRVLIGGHDDTHLAYIQIVAAEGCPEALVEYVGGSVTRLRVSIADAHRQNWWQYLHQQDVSSGGPPILPVCERAQISNKFTTYDVGCRAA